MNGDRDQPKLPPILANKAFASPSVFEPANLLREARRQKGLACAEVPEICVLDPDGDILRVLRRKRRAPVAGVGLIPHRALQLRPGIRAPGHHRLRGRRALRGADIRAVIRPDAGSS
jgi:hypothetical protein